MITYRCGVIRGVFFRWISFNNRLRLVEVVEMVVLYCIVTMK